MKEVIRNAVVNDEASLKTFLDQLEDKMERLSRKSSQLHYERLRFKKSIPEMKLLETEKAEALQSPALFDILETFKGRVSDHRLARRLDCWSDLATLQMADGDPRLLELTNDLMDAIMQYKYPLADNPEGTIADVRHVLRTEHDRDLRRQAWECVEPLALRLKDQMLALHKTRNEKAHSLGFKTYAHLLMEKQGTEPEMILDLLYKLNAGTQAEYEDILLERAERFGLKEIHPWDTQYLLDGGIDIPEGVFTKDMITPRLEEYSKLHGLDMKELGITPEYLDIPWNGLCMTVNSRKDARIMCNPRDGYTYYRTMFHELGHGLHTVLNDQPEFIFLGEPSPSAESMAETFGYFTRYPEWLKHIGIADKDLKDVMRALLAPWFYYLRFRGAYASFGIEIYLNQERDLDALLGSIEHTVTGATAVATPRWTGNAWFVAGMPWHNYIVADMVASQIHDGLHAKFGHVYGNPEAIDFLRQEYLSLGTSVPWRKKLANISGSDLGVDALINDVKRFSKGEVR